MPLALPCKHKKKRKKSRPLVNFYLGTQSLYSTCVLKNRPACSIANLRCEAAAASPNTSCLHSASVSGGSAAPWEQRPRGSSEDRKEHQQQQLSRNLVEKKKRKSWSSAIFSRVCLVRSVLRPWVGRECQGIAGGRRSSQRRRASGAERRFLGEEGRTEGNVACELEALFRRCGRTGCW